MAANVPFAFDVDFYRDHYPDLAHLTADEATEHFYLYGAEEGRQGVAAGCRSAFVERLQAQRSILEIGPFCNPIVRGDDVRYLDVLDAAQLRARATEIGIDAGGCPEEIHYLGYIDAIAETFDAVVSSHSIEHQPDLIRHIQGVYRLLRPGGEYCLFVPDKRYSFDHFIAESSIAEVVQAHVENRSVHTMRSVIEHRALTTHNDPAAHWRGEHGEQHPANQAARIMDAISEYRANDSYIDVHTWYFTPTSFWHIASALHACGMTGLRPVEIYPTVYGTFEFIAVLRRD